MCNNNTPAIASTLNGEELPSQIIEEEVSNKFNSNEIDTTQYLSAFNSDQDYTLPATVLCKSNDVSIRFLLDIGALHCKVTTFRLTWPPCWRSKASSEQSVVSECVPP
jgi:hypothetical protein